MSTATTTDEKSPSFKEVMAKASKSAVRGGTAGACAMGANVACLMVCLNASVMLLHAVASCGTSQSHVVSPETS